MSCSRLLGTLTLTLWENSSPSTDVVPDRLLTKEEKTYPLVPSTCNGHSLLLMSATKSYFYWNSLMILLPFPEPFLVKGWSTREALQASLIFWCPILAIISSPLQTKREFSARSCTSLGVPFITWTSSNALILPEEPSPWKHSFRLRGRAS